MFIFRTLGLKCVTLLPRIMGPILALLESSQQGLRDFLFQQLGILVSIVKQHIRPYLPKVLLLVHEFWPQRAFQAQILYLVGEVASALKDEFKAYIPQLVPKMLAVLHEGPGDPRAALASIKVMAVLELLDNNLAPYLDGASPAPRAISGAPYRPGRPLPCDWGVPLLPLSPSPSSRPPHPSHPAVAPPQWRSPLWYPCSSRTPRARTSASPLSIGCAACRAASRSRRTARASCTRSHACWIPAPPSCTGRA